MALLVRMLKQRAVYWAPKKVDQYAEEVYELPVEIRCRWETEATQGFPFEGKETVSATMVYMDRDPEIGGKLLFGLLKDLKSPLPPPPEAQRILMIEIVPNLRIKRWLRVAKF